jgi:hypothetical protein
MSPFSLKEKGAKGKAKVLPKATAGEHPPQIGTTTGVSGPIRIKENGHNRQKERVGEKIKAQRMAINTLIPRLFGATSTKNLVTRQIGVSTTQTARADRPSMQMAYGVTLAIDRAIPLPIATLPPFAS